MEQNKYVNIHDVAEFIIRRCTISDFPITNLKLQKLLYYLQAWHLVYFDKHPLFQVEPEAWVNGPVYREIYNQYKPYSYFDIKLGFEKSNKESYDDSLKKLGLTKKQEEYIQSFFDHFGNKSAEELVMMTHKDAPWNQARRDAGRLEYSNEVISHDLMYEYYSQFKKK